MALANETPGSRVLDFGCGTGRLTVALANAGHVVTGVDPARASLAVARTKAGAKAVTWLEGTHDVLPEAKFDLIVMSSHVAQFFVDDLEWQQAISNFRRALIPGGRLVFDAYDPSARSWERWNPTDSLEQVRLPNGQPVTIWAEVISVHEPDVMYTIHYRFEEDGAHLLSRSTLRFRSESEWRVNLVRAGFEVETIYGSWDRSPIGPPNKELIVVARAA
jgi:SAM-dependent methyltransferase